MSAAFLLLLRSAHSVEPLTVGEIARGNSWVSPYWGYSTPKVACDGTAWYTAGLWGVSPETAEGTLYKCDRGGEWRSGACFSNIYQPITLALDSQGRLIAVHTVLAAPVCLYRSKLPGNIDDMERLPPPADMTTAYYIGIAIRGDWFYLAYLDGPENSMYLSVLRLSTLEWLPRRLVCEGQIREKPKTAWTYPILFPVEDGLHLVASNSPDGGEGNTYNQVWHVFFPVESQEPPQREMVADSPMGSMAYAMDFTVDKDGGCHILFLWQQHVYGPPVPQDSPQPGIYHAWRAPGSDWQRAFLAPSGYAGLCETGQGIFAAVTSNILFRWEGSPSGWKSVGALWDTGNAPQAPGFLDVLTKASGSDMHPGIALVMDSLEQTRPDGTQERVLWSALPR